MLARLILEINIRQRVAVVIFDDEEGVVRLIDGPRRWEAARCAKAKDPRAACPKGPKSEFDASTRLFVSGRRGVGGWGPPKSAFARFSIATVRLGK